MADVPDDGDGSPLEIGTPERLAALDDCLSRLPAMYAGAIQSAYRDSHTLAQIARLEIQIVGIEARGRPLFDEFFLLRREG